MRLRPHPCLSSHCFEFGERDGINLELEVADEWWDDGIRDIKQDEHVGCKAHAVLGKAHVPPRVRNDAHEAIRFLLVRGKKLAVSFSFTFSALKAATCLRLRSLLEKSACVVDFFFVDPSCAMKPAKGTSPSSRSSG